MKLTVVSTQLRDAWAQQNLRAVPIVPVVCALHQNYKSRAGKSRLPIRRFPSKLCATLDFSRRLRMVGNQPPSSSDDLDAPIGAGPDPIAVGVQRSADVPKAAGNTIVYCGNPELVG